MSRTPNVASTSSRSEATGIKLSTGSNCRPENQSGHERLGFPASVFRSPITTVRSRMKSILRAPHSPPVSPKYPEFRYMGSKHRLLPWIHSVLRTIEFQTAADPFVGSGCVGYLMKAMGKRVLASDFLNFPAIIADATIANPRCRLDNSLIDHLAFRPSRSLNFITRTFQGIFYNIEDLHFLDSISENIDEVRNRHLRAMALAALFRACLKKQPRGVFTVSGDPSHYDDGRRDLRVSLRDHFIEQAHTFNRLVFNNGHHNSVKRADVFDLHPQGIDLVYLDAPYVPRSQLLCKEISFS
jgi:DNA adenine methylase/adenine-specific DNA-methyltransferase